MPGVIEGVACGAGCDLEKFFLQFFWEYVLSCTDIQIFTQNCELLGLNVSSIV